MTMMIGMKFNRLTVLSFSHKMNRKAHWICLCKCGNKKIIEGYNIRSGLIKSCGCFQIDLLKGQKGRHTTHGMTRTREYKTWINMRERCNDVTCKDYKNYGGRGIQVCEDWEKFENFYADMGKKPKGLSIDRINNDGNYEPGNCKWSTRIEQNNNKRNTITV